MENIRFIAAIMEYSERDGKRRAGNYILCPMRNGNVAKLCCESNGVRAEIINKTEGQVDRTLFPFANYFAKKQCSPGAPLWDQHIDNGKWYFDHYPQCRPTTRDYIRMAQAVDQYIEIME